MELGSSLLNTTEVCIYNIRITDFKSLAIKWGTELCHKVWMPVQKSRQIIFANFLAIGLSMLHQYNGILHMPYARWKSEFFQPKYPSDHYLLFCRCQKLLLRMCCFPWNTTYFALAAIPTYHAWPLLLPFKRRLIVLWSRPNAAAAARIDLCLPSFTSLQARWILFSFFTSSTDFCSRFATLNFAILIVINDSLSSYKAPVSTGSPSRWLYPALPHRQGCCRDSVGAVALPDDVALPRVVLYVVTLIVRGCYKWACRQVPICRTYWKTACRSSYLPILLPLVT